MTAFTAITKSGTVWSYDGHRLQIAPQRGPAHSFKPLFIKGIDRDTIPEEVTSEHSLLAWIEHEAPNIPVTVGKSIYAIGLREWRLSTPVAEIPFDEAVA